MRLPGWCEKCDRPRTVTCSGAALAFRPALPVGICDECDLREQREIAGEVAPSAASLRAGYVGPCGCECCSGGFCGGCGHAGCGGR